MYTLITRGLKRNNIAPLNRFLPVVAGFVQRSNHNMDILFETNFSRQRLCQTCAEFFISNCRHALQCFFLCFILLCFHCFQFLDLHLKDLDFFHDIFFGCSPTKRWNKC